MKSTLVVEVSRIDVAVDNSIIWGGGIGTAVFFFFKKMGLYSFRLLFEATCFFCNKLNYYDAIRSLLIECFRIQ